MRSNNISFGVTNKDLSCHSGLVFFEKLFKQLKLNKKLWRLLPRKKKDRGLKQINKIKGILFSFAVGNDCLSDLDSLSKDPLFIELIGAELPARTSGDFISRFHNRQIEKIQRVLFEMALELRMKLFKEDKDFILSMDSTPHQQYGLQMEKLGLNYKGIWGFDSQNACDQHGFSYLFDLRPGNTHTSKDAHLWIHHVFSKIPKEMNRFFRADSGYSNQKIYSALRAAEAKFTIVLKENVGKYVRKKNRAHIKWKKTDLYFFGSKDCEVASGVYPVQGCGNLRVVFIRRKKSDEEIESQLDLLSDYNSEEDNYKHYSIITNIDSTEKTEEEIINFYRGRANCENFIKEQKNGFDFFHFPCKRFNANRIWGILGTFAHNMTRYLSFCMGQKTKRVRDKKTKEIKTVIQQGYFAKKVRNELIKIPCQLARSARKIKIRLNQQAKEVMEKIITDIQTKFRMEDFDMT